MYDLRGFVEAVRAILSGHALDAPGAYRRWDRQNAEGTRDLGLNPYGCADAANLLYTIGAFPREPRERESWIATLRELQDPASGFFREATHHEIHTTAHCIAALELFDAGPAHPLRGLAPLRDAEAMERFLEGLEWRTSPWGASHQGAGLFAALALAGEAGWTWQDRYFAWLWENADPDTGLFRRGCVGPVGRPPSVFPHLAGTFHYLFNLEYARRPLRYPGALVDTCLEIYERKAFPLVENVGFAAVDWVYGLTRSHRQSGHRRDEVLAALNAFARDHVTYLLGLDPRRDDRMNDLHLLFGALCGLAELQAALPGQLRTEHPLRLVLDRRPFI